MHKKELILVVDDDEGFLDTVTTILTDSGYKADRARTGNEALKKIGEEFYDLLLVDVRLPDIDGVQLIARITDTDPKMRKIFLTGYPSIDNVQQALSAGAHAYIIKPIDAEKLLATIKQQLKEREKEIRERYVILK